MKDEDKVNEENKDKSPLATDEEYLKLNEEKRKKDERRGTWLNALGDILGLFFK